MFCIVFDEREERQRFMFSLSLDHKSEYMPQSYFASNIKIQKCHKYNNIFPGRMNLITNAKIQCFMLHFCLKFVG